MKPKKRKNHVPRVSYSRLRRQTEKEIRKLIRDCNPEEKERFWKRLEKALAEEEQKTQQEHEEENP